jgi:ABC-type antimicrobial peptide transport system permease subunit
MTAVVIFAARGLTRRRLQTALLLFALSIALAATMTIMAVLSGIKEQMRRDVEQVGMDVINVHVSPSVKSLMTSQLRLADCDWMREVAGGLVAPFFATMGVAESTAGTGSAGNAMNAGGDPKSETVQTLLLQTTADWGRIVPLELIEGRFFEPGETGVGVLDEWVAKKLFPDGRAVGRLLRVKRLGLPQTLRVVGVMKDPFEIRKKFEELDVTGSARSRILRMMEFKSIYAPGSFTSPSQTIHGAVIKTPAGRDPVEFEKPLNDRLGDRRESVWIWARKQWIGSVVEAADFGTQVANVVWIIVLIVTGVMITTVALVAIRERYREIAIRRTEGARRAQIVGQLLMENLLLSGVSGLLAVGLAHWAAAILHARYISWPPAFLAVDVSLALGMGIVLGAVATVLPAMRAAALDPVDVLRNA